MAVDPDFELVLRKRRHELAYARYVIGYGSVIGLLVLLISVGAAWAEGRPIDLDHSIDMVFAGLLALAAGCCLAGRKIMLRWLRMDARSPEPTNPQAKSLTGQLRLLSWAGIIMTSVGFALLLLYALSVGCDHPEWTAWLPRRRH